ncbi:DUF929 family protein [Ktedonospora formicarum]|nr:DUF929 family protein [Ktedonospora formicarum]
MAKSKKKRRQAASTSARVEVHARSRLQPSSIQRNPNAQRRRQTHKRISPWMPIGGILLVVAIVIGAFAVLGQQNQHTGSSGPTDQEVLKMTTSIEPDTLNAIGDGGLKAFFQAPQGKPAILKGSTGKPMVFYSGAEFCPLCAGERWSIVVALSRFGTFSALPETSSASEDNPPSLATFSFNGSKYQSNYIDFEAVEQYTNQRSGNFYAPLQTPSDAQQKLIDTYNAPPYVDQQSAGGFPFVDIANQYITTGPSLNVEVLANLTQKQIAAKLADRTTDVAKNVLGAANYMTAAICKITNDQPSTVCNESSITRLKQTLPSSQGSDQLALNQLPIALVKRRDE